jgi:hypothetical protein
MARDTVNPVRQAERGSRLGPGGLRGRQAGRRPRGGNLPNQGTRRG